MVSKDPIHRFLASVPESYKRLVRFFRNPYLHLESSNDPDLEYVLLDYIAALAALGAAIATIGTFLPGYLEIDPVSILRMDMFLVLLTVNTVSFSICLWLASAVILAVSGLKLHGAIFYQGIKAYALLNIPVAIVFIIALNRIVVIGDVTEPTGNGDLVFATMAVFCAFALSIWLVAIPIGKYLRSKYRAAIAYPLALVVLVISVSVNPAIASGYFSNVIDKRAVCEQYVSFRHGTEIQEGMYNKDCLIGQCIAAFE
ncbi:hypothetical protein E4656_12255 [Natronospirillum operosum]|uniref:Yip1 domain-containing protein n=1 Tax=Natronospirillum operosum TaxID=2759953 RepID=A0A4Z0WF21_9GAMM|nr:hypothetical protein [Natronospirillum operosum]TGG92888.1 hypothetical protein E4656_12255 [Natronospirillum operosum]